MHVDPDLKAYKQALRQDPCTYCGGPGGTIDHVTARALGGGRHDAMNMTGACPECNRKKDKGEGHHLDALTMLLTRRDWHRAQAISALRIALKPGDEVYTPWGERAIVREVAHGSIYAWLPEQDRDWRCANPFSLRGAAGERLALAA